MSAPLSAFELTALRAIEPQLQRKLVEVSPRGMQVWFTPEGSPTGYPWTVTLFPAALGSEVTGRGYSLSQALVLALQGL